MHCQHMHNEALISATSFRKSHSARTEPTIFWYKHSVSPSQASGAARREQTACSSCSSTSFLSFPPVHAKSWAMRSSDAFVSRQLRARAMCIICFLTRPSAYWGSCSGGRGWVRMGRLQRGAADSKQHIAACAYLAHRTWLLAPARFEPTSARLVAEHVRVQAVGAGPIRAQPRPATRTRRVFWQLRGAHRQWSGRGCRIRHRRRRRLRLRRRRCRCAPS